MKYLLILCLCLCGLCAHAQQDVPQTARQRYKPPVSTPFSTKAAAENKITTSVRQSIFRNYQPVIPRPASPPEEATRTQSNGASSAKAAGKVNTPKTAPSQPTGPQGDLTPNERIPSRKQ